MPFWQYRRRHLRAVSSQVPSLRAIWQFGQVQVYDGGPNGVAGAKDATLFEDQGVFAP